MHRILLSTLLIDAPSDRYDQTTQFWAGAFDAQVVCPRGMDDYRILDGASDDFRSHPDEAAQAVIIIVRIMMIDDAAIRRSGADGGAKACECVP